MRDYPERIVKPIANSDGTYGKAEYKLDLIEGVHIYGPQEMMSFKGKGILQALQEDMTREWREDLNHTPFMDAVARENMFMFGVQPFNTIGAPMNKVTYGRLVRIPVANPREGSYVYEDVTVKTAKKRAKAARKLARRIDKACR